MAERRWTTQQRQAIEDRGGALLLSAAAGSGKTAVLTQRAVERIADEHGGAQADSLLIVTFTNAAAAELRQRMAAALEAKLAERPDDLYLKRQKLLLARAAICTVDAFCIDLLTQHFNETELPADFTLLKPAEETALREAALEETLEAAYEDEDFRRFASQYDKARSDAQAASAVLSLYDITRAMADPEGWWASLGSDYDVHTTPADTRWGALLLEDAAVLLEGVQRRLRCAQKLAADWELDACLPALEGDLAQTDRLLARVRARDWQGCCDGAGTLAFARFGTVRTKNLDPRAAAAKELVKALRDECKKRMNDLAKQCFPSGVGEFLAEQELCRPMVRALTSAVRRFAGLLAAKKQEARAFTFDDFEHAALRLLEDENGGPTPLARELSEQYVMVMVDEYQDSNDLQNRLYRMLARPDGANQFYVGDVKQSIYGFREAKPEFFLEKREAYAPYDGVHYPASILLTRNFRSTRAVIGAVNDVFGAVFRRAAGGLDYTAGEQLVPGLESYALDVPAEVLLTDTRPEKAPAGAEGAEEGTEGAEAPEAAAGGPADDSGPVAARIAQLLAEGAPVREGDGTRPCRPGDICILLRSPGSRARRYTEKLEALGIGAFCAAEDELLADPEVQLLLSCLRVLDNPGQDIHLAAVLLSPLVGLSPDDLAAVRSRRPRGTLYAALLAEREGPVPAFLARLRALRRRSLGMPVQEICAMLLDETGLYHLAGAMPGGESCQQNLRAFEAVSAEYAGSGGLAGFLRLVDAAVKNGRPLADARGRSAPSDKVQLMSIHASKGLEFPIVIVANAGQRFNDDDARSNFLCRSEMGVAFRLQVAGSRQLAATLASRALVSRTRRDAANEEMRLLYVAMTRARDRLILSWHSRNPGGELRANAQALAACGGVPDTLALRETGTEGMSHWLMLALLAHPDGGALREACGAPDFALRKAEGHFRFEFCRPEAAAADPDILPAHTAEPDPALLAALRENFARPAAAPAGLPVKVSVSELAHRDAAPVLDKPSFLYREGMTAAQRGTALHSFLQLADLAAARRDPGAELARLVQGGWLEADAAANIDLGALERFLHSPLADRMLSAKTLLREVEFISRIPSSLLPDARQPGSVFLLGIADCVLLFGDGTAELVDYKTDRGKTPQQLLEAYAGQLALYRDAVEKRMRVRVVRSVIYSFALSAEIEVP